MGQRIANRKEVRKNGKTKFHLSLSLCLPLSPSLSLSSSDEDELEQRKRMALCALFFSCYITLQEGTNERKEDSNKQWEGKNRRSWEYILCREKKLGRRILLRAEGKKWIESEREGKQEIELMTAKLIPGKEHVWIKREWMRKTREERN